MYYEFILVFICGLLVKVVDNIEDRKKGKFLIKWPLAIVYGILIGYLISQTSFSMFFLGALLAQVLAGKIDKPAHILGFLLSIVSAVYFGLPNLDYLPFVIFFITAYLDELTLFGFWKIFIDYRLFLKIAALAFIAIGRVDYLISVVTFDVGYLIAEKIR